MMNHNKEYRALINTNLDVNDLLLTKTVYINSEHFFQYVNDNYEYSFVLNLEENIYVNVYQIINEFNYDKIMPYHYGNKLFIWNIECSDKRIKYFEYDPKSNFGKYLSDIL